MALNPEQFPLEALRAALSEMPSTPEGDRLLDALGSAYTSSSEMLGEIGLALRDYEVRLSDDTPPELRQAFDEVLSAVRRVWRSLS